MCEPLTAAYFSSFVRKRGLLTYLLGGSDDVNDDSCTGENSPVRVLPSLSCTRANAVLWSCRSRPYTMRAALQLLSLEVQFSVIDGATVGNGAF